MASGILGTMNFYEEINKGIDESLSLLEAIKSDELLMEEINKAAHLIVKAVQSNKTIFWCGNGGSSSMSQHFAAEFVGRYQRERKPLRSIALNADTAILTCIANDYGYSNVFSRQIECLGGVGDILVAISTSGRSENILNAIREAHKKDLVLVGMFGTDGCELNSVLNSTIRIPSHSTARIQEAHELICHIICAIVDKSLSTKLFKE